MQDDEIVLFGDFIIFGQAREDRIYEEIKDHEKLKSVLMDYLEDYNAVTGKDMKLILFQDAIEHITRLTRLLRGERGNGLLVGECSKAEKHFFPALKLCHFRGFWHGKAIFDSPGISLERIPVCADRTDQRLRSQLVPG